MKLRVLTRTLSYERLKKLTLVSSLAVNEFFDSRYITGESFFSWLSPVAVSFISVYKVKCFLGNIFKRY